MDIKKIHEAFKETNMSDMQIPTILVTTSIGNVTPVKVGEIFGMDIMADPLCPPNHWYLIKEPDYVKKNR